MGAGDVLILAWSVSAAGAITFQPSAGTEFMITQLICSYIANTATYVAITDGTTDVKIPISNGEKLSLRVGITNSKYLKFNATAAGEAIIISGMQTKGSAVKMNGKVLKDEELDELREKWLARRKAAIGVEKIKVTLTDKVVDAVLSEVREDRDDLGKLRGVVCFYAPQTA